MNKGSLVIVGSGILAPAHLSQESIAKIKSADCVHVLVPDPLGLSTINKLNSNVKNLAELYYRPDCKSNGNNRLASYRLMADAILKDVRAGLNVCAIFYGHAGVFVYPSHLAIENARAEGFEAKMLPAISAEDCLYADLGIDPGDSGCIAFEASQFLFYHRQLDINAALILWQIGVVGDTTLTQLKPSADGLKMLQAKLSQWYPESHQLTLYEATTLPIKPARIETIKLADLANASVKPITTLYIPPLDEPKLDYAFLNDWSLDLSALENPQ